MRGLNRFASSCRLFLSNFLIAESRIRRPGNMQSCLTLSNHVQSKRDHLTRAEVLYDVSFHFLLFFFLARFPFCFFFYSTFRWSFRSMEWNVVYLSSARRLCSIELIDLLGRPTCSHTEFPRILNGRGGDYPIFRLKEWRLFQGRKLCSDRLFKETRYFYTVSHLMQFCLSFC